MIQEELSKTLNPKQVQYMRMDLPDPRNGEYLLAVFHLIPSGELNIMQAAAEVAAESSTGTNFAVKTETPFSRVMNASSTRLTSRRTWSGSPSLAPVR